VENQNLKQFLARAKGAVDVGNKMQMKTLRRHFDDDSSTEAEYHVPGQSNYPWQAEVQTASSESVTTAAIPRRGSRS
jgi:hypothetical protein